MDQYGQTNDLQQAIDQAANKQDNIQDELGVPPMPPTEGAGAPDAPFADGAPMPDGAAAPAADGASDGVSDGAGSPFPPATPVATDAAAPATDGGAADVPAAVPVSDAPAEPSAEAILSDAVPADGDLAKVREGILRDLMPLMDKVNSTPEEKFDIYKEAMNTLHDKSLISGAYKEATKFTDETKKADALIGLMQEIDKA